MNSNTGTSDLVITGIDPGLVHTGVVRIELLRDLRMIYVSSYAFPGLDPVPIRTWLDQFREYQGPVYVEAYRPRSHFDTDARMQKGVQDIAKLLGGKIVNNTGVKKIITPDLMNVFGLSNFRATHHQDLEAAARIALYGAVKDKELNPRLSQVVADHLANKPWHVNN